MGQCVGEQLRAMRFIPFNVYPACWTSEVQIFFAAKKWGLWLIFTPFFFFLSSFAVVCTHCFCFSFLCFLTLSCRPTSFTHKHEEIYHNFRGKRSIHCYECMLLFSYKLMRFIVGEFHSLFLLSFSLLFNTLLLTNMFHTHLWSNLSWL